MINIVQEKLNQMTPEQIGYDISRTALRKKKEFKNIVNVPNIEDRDFNIFLNFQPNAPSIEDEEDAQESNIYLNFPPKLQRQPFTLKVPRYLGSGNNGCIISPAIIFTSSNIITEANRQNFVSKIAIDAEEEYYIIKAVERRNKLLRSDIQIGIYPVDDLFCGVTKDDLGIYGNEIAERCEPILDVKGKNFKKYFGGGKHSDDYCVIQYPRYFSDLMDLTVSTDAYKKLLIQSAVQKLIALRDIQVLHLDLHKANICVLKQDEFEIYFADFGRALLFDQSYESLLRYYNDFVTYRLESYFTYYGLPQLPLFNIQRFFKDFNEEKDEVKLQLYTEQGFFMLHTIDIYQLQNALLDVFCKKDRKYIKDDIYNFIFNEFKSLKEFVDEKYDIFKKNVYSLLD